jgi:glucosamine-6-phosphate deaminase
VKILIFPSSDAACAMVAEHVIVTVKADPECVLGLATGGTMRPVYAKLRQAATDGDANFGGVTTFNLDEYVGLAPSHPCSYRHFMSEELFSGAGFSRDRTYVPRGDAPDASEEAARYERLIAEHGPIDLQLLGLGINGHIGFNEPMSSLGSRTRIKTLTRATREANSRFFADGEEPPQQAVTVGIQTILESCEIILLVTGQNKAIAVAQMVEGPLAALCPATALQLHPNVTVVLDREAASKLQFTDYYSEVHSGGREA